jgi:hypothetical protein
MERFILSSADRFAGVWGREELEILLYGSDTALRRRPRYVSV